MDFLFGKIPSISIWSIELVLQETVEATRNIESNCSVAKPNGRSPRADCGIRTCKNKSENTGGSTISTQVLQRVVKKCGTRLLKAEVHMGENVLEEEEAERV